VPEAHGRADWTFRVNVKIDRAIPPTPDAGRVAAMFGLGDREAETLYENFELAVRVGQIVAITGPSGAGKSVLLGELARRADRVVWLRPAALARSDRSAVDLLAGGELAERLAMLSQCGLAEAPALITPASRLSGGQAYRLALARALHAAARRAGPALVLADEFAATLDEATAVNLCRRMRKLITPSRLALVVATPRADLLDALRPDVVVVKPLAGPARLLTPPSRRGRRGRSDPGGWPIRRGTIRDYAALAGFHYLAGPPAAHKRVYVIDTPSAAKPDWRSDAAAGPDVAAVLVVSPPLATVRGRNLATAGRYAGPDRSTAMDLLNREIECISRVIVHPIVRGCGLAVRLVRHAIATARTPMVEALAAMGAVHPFCERAGMTAYRLGTDRHAARLVSAAEAVGLSRADLAAVGPVKDLLARRGAAGRFLRGELDLCVRRSLGPAHRARVADPMAEVCRRTARRYVYYLAQRNKENRPCRPPEPAASR